MPYQIIVKILNLAILLLLLLVAHQANANGGPVYLTMGVVSNATIFEFKQVPNVKLTREDLYIRLGYKTHVVQAIYHLNSTEKQQIDYVFPQELWIPSHEEKTQKRVLNTLNRKISMTLNGKNLPVEENIHFFNENNKNDLLERMYAGHAVELRWHTQLALKKGQNKLVIKYEIPAIEDAWGTNKSPQLSTTTEFEYHFFPASFWGDGTVDELNVIIDASGVFDSGVFSWNKTRDGDDTDYYKIEDVFNLRNKIYELKTQHSRNYNLKTLGGLHFEFPGINQPEYRQIFQGKYSDYAKYPVKILEATSAKPGYPVTALTDRKYETAYVPDKLPAKISFEIIPCYTICYLTNGFLKNKATYDNNRIIAEMTISCDNDAASELNYIKTGEINEAPWENADGVMGKNHFIRLFSRYCEGLGSSMEQSMESNPDAIRPTTCHLEITETYPGIASKDLALSELTCAHITLEH